MSAADPSVVVIGVGNELRGDDAAGLLVARVVRERLVGDCRVSVREHAGEPLDLLELWRGARAAIVVDAVRSGASAGSVIRIDASREAIRAGTLRTSSHLVSVAEAIELARALGALPDVVVMYGIEGACFSADAACSDAVAAAIEPVAERVARDACAFARLRF